MRSVPNNVDINNFSLNNFGIQIETPNGFEDFTGVNKISKPHYFHIMFSDCSEIKGSDKHPLIDVNGDVVLLKDLQEGDKIRSKDGIVEVVWVDMIEEDIGLYDIIDSGKDNIYYTNGILSHNCHFMGSQDTLIASRILQTLMYQNPIEDYDSLKVYKRPIEDRMYAVIVDTGEGIGRDYSAISVIDITEIPYEVVATYRNNEVSPLMLPTLVDNIARTYNTALTFFELQSVGREVANTMYHDLEYENVVLVGSKGGRQTVGSGTNLQPGVKTSTMTKSVGCSNMKTLIEQGKLIVNDLDTISELGTFISKGKSFEADEGCNDDMVATMFLFSWLTTQEYFKEYTSRDIRKNIIHNDELLFESLVPFGIIPQIEEEEYEIEDDGTIWQKVHGNNGDDDYGLGHGSYDGSGMSFLD